MGSLREIHNNSSHLHELIWSTILESIGIHTWDLQLHIWQPAASGEIFIDQTDKITIVGTHITQFLDCKKSKWNITYMEVTKEEKEDKRSTLPRECNALIHRT